MYNNFMLAIFFFLIENKTSMWFVICFVGEANQQRLIPSTNSLWRLFARHSYDDPTYSRGTSLLGTRESTINLFSNVRRGLSLRH